MKIKNSFKIQLSIFLSQHDYQLKERNMIDYFFKVITLILIKKFYLA